MNMKRIMALTAGAALMAPWAWGADSAKQAQEVLSDLHHANQMEIQMGKMAKEKGVSDAVRNYADMLVKDHQNADQKVQDLAQKNGITLTAPSTEGIVDRYQASKEQRVMTELSQKTGKDFDKAFADAMVDDHKHDISKLEKAQKSLAQSDVKELVSNILPTLRDHLTRAEQIQKSS